MIWFSSSHLQVSAEIVSKHADSSGHSIGDESFRGDDVERSVLLRLTEELLLTSAPLMELNQVSDCRVGVGDDDFELVLVADWLKEVKLQRPRTLHWATDTNEHEPVRG